MTGRKLSRRIRPRQLLCVFTLALVGGGAIHGSALAASHDRNVRSSIVRDSACGPYKLRYGRVTISNLRVYRVSCSRAAGIAASWVTSKRSASGWRCKSDNSRGSGGGSCQATGSKAYLYWFAASRR